MLVLNSCQGFTPSLEVLCCTQNSCDISYTATQLQDLGYNLSSGLEPLTCHELSPNEDVEAASAPRKAKNELEIALAVSSGVLIMVSLVVLALWRQRHLHRLNAAKEEEMQVRRLNERCSA